MVITKQVANIIHIAVFLMLPKAPMCKLLVLRKSTLTQVRDATHMAMIKLNNSKSCCTGYIMKVSPLVKNQYDFRLLF